MQKSFFRYLLFGKHEPEEKVLELFQYTLLKHILFTVTLLGFFIATFSLLGLFPLGDFYMYMLYVFSMVSAVMYYFAQKSNRYYIGFVHGIIWLSFVTLGVMLVLVVHDEFRLVWFFLLSFAAFVLGGKRYGFIVTFFSIGMVLLLFYMYDLHISVYAMTTFVVSLLGFMLFLYYFLTKLTYDTSYFEQRVEDEVNKRQTQEQILLRQYRMANMGEMIDAIAHQWRQPLANANMILLNMAEEPDNKVYIEEKIELLTNINAHMSQTIDDFRHLLHDDKNKTIFQLHTAIEEVLTLMHNQLENVEVQYTNRMNHKIVGYKNELIQVLVTLLSNAIEALEHTEIRDKRISLIVQEQKESCLIHIEDNAGGIKAEVEQTLFESYVTTKGSVGGTGLGLYIAKIIVENTMQGKLSVKQGLAGARFTIEIKREL